MNDFMRALDAQDELIRREIEESDPNEPLDFTPRDVDLTKFRQRLAERRNKAALNELES